MASVIWLTGLLVAGLGIGIILQPVIFTKTLKAFKKQVFLYLVGTIRSALGVIFLVWARSCNKPLIIIIFGILMIFSAAVIFLVPKTRLFHLMDFFLKRPQWLHRIWGLAAVAIGAIIIWAGWPK